MKNYYIMGTGTDVGKTLVTSLLAYQARKAAWNACVFKPVISGFEGTETDAHMLLRALGRDVNEQTLSIMSPWRLKAPISPDMAAAREGISLSANEIANACMPKNKPDLLLVEAAGGVMTPINERETMLDIGKHLDMPIVFVAGTYLGSISHTLSALAGIQTAGLSVGLLVLSTSKTQPVPAEETAKTLRAFVGETLPIFILSRLGGENDLWKKGPNLLEQLP